MKYASLGLEKVFLGTLRNRWSSLLSTLQGNDKYWFLVESVSCDGRVVKALDSKSNGVSPHRFESCSWRALFFPLQGVWRKPLGFHLSFVPFPFCLGNRSQNVSPLDLGEEGGWGWPQEAFNDVQLYWLLEYKALREFCNFRFASSFDIPCFILSRGRSKRFGSRRVKFCSGMWMLVVLLIVKTGVSR